ncbi:MAG: hypothetical protein QM677_03740 [Microbacterium sp.]
MDTLVALAVTAPALVAAGAGGWFVLRGQRTARARRLAFSASREEVRIARKRVTAARIEVRVARAELSRVQAERAAGRASADEISAARRALDAAQRETKAASATLRARRATLVADRAALAGRINDPAQLPLARLMAADDVVTTRWMEYETDAARQLAFPAMSDTRVPATAAFFAELHTTRALRPPSPDTRMTPAEFGAYRDAVSRLTRAFDVAETEAWEQARAAGSAPDGPGPGAPRSGAPRPGSWVSSAQAAAQNLAQTLLAQGAEALARATAPRRGTDDDSNHA